MIPARRRWLAGIGLGLLAPALLSATPAKTEGLRLARRWTTGNTRLAPATPLKRQVLCAGDRNLALFDIDEPAPLWALAHHLPAGNVFRPRHAADTVVCGNREEIAAWSLATGELLWRYNARIQIGVPCVHGNGVFFGDGHELVALRLDSGAEQWRFAAIADTLISYAPVATDATVYVGPGDGRLYALAVVDGRLRWKQNRMDDWQYLRQMHIADQVLVAGGYTEKLHGIDLDSGRQLWEFNAGNFINSHHVATGTAYLWSPTGWIYAIDTRSGIVRWRHRTTDYRSSRRNWGSLLAELTTRDDRLYALDLNHVLHVLDIADGTEVTRHPLPEPVQAFVQPVTEDGLLFGARNGSDLLLIRSP